MRIETGRQMAESRPIRIPTFRRIYGLGSVFGKALRDSRRGALIVTIFLAVLLLISGAFVSSTWGTAETRQEGVALTANLPPVFTGLYGGTAINPGTLGGFTNWRYGVLFLVAPGIWSLLALSKTLTGEARRGSLDFLAAEPLSRRRIALQKLGGHVAAVLVSMFVLAVVAWLVGQGFSTLPGDEIPLEAAFGQAALMALAALVAGSIAFALAPFVGRGAAASLAAAVMAASWIVNGYRESISLFDTLTPLSYYHWTAGHRPLAGVYDWPSLLYLVAIVLVAGTVGVLAFERRDLGASGSLRIPGLPKALMGTGGPLRRSAAERLTTALAWGAGIGVYALIVSTSSEDLRELMTSTPSLRDVMQTAFPTLDLNDPGFALQLLFVQIGTLFIGLAAAAIVGGWASDEVDGRLELLLTTSVARARWFASTTLGAYLIIVVTSVVVALATGIGLAATGEDPLKSMTGVLVLALYGTAMAGVGVAVGGLWRPSAAGAAVAVAVVALLMIDILVPALNLPDWVGELALRSHYGEPMVGNWNPVGIVVSLALAIGGLALGAWGFSRRDLRD